MSAVLIPGSERLIVVVGPSGVGKDTLLGAWRAAAGPALGLARRSIDRPAQPGAEDHEPLRPAAWADACASQAFALHWQANGHGYGIRWRELAPLAAGQWLLLNGSRAALPEIRQRAPGCQVLAITASPATVARRLQERGREDADAIARRLARQPAVQADFTLVNEGSVAEAVAQLQRLFRIPRTTEPT